MRRRNMPGTILAIRACGRAAVEGRFPLKKIAEKNSEKFGGFILPTPPIPESAVVCVCGEITHMFLSRTQRGILFRSLIVCAAVRMHSAENAASLAAARRGEKEAPRAAARLPRRRNNRQRERERACMDWKVRVTYRPYFRSRISRRPCRRRPRSCHRPRPAP